jgi:hypothetical protein
MLDPDQAAQVAAQFGVSDLQVRRDHLISHLLAVLGRHFGDDLVFFGGTALARTHLPDGRLSEDIDLVTIPPRAEVAARIERVLVTGVRREYGTLSWDPSLVAVTGSASAVLRSKDGLQLRVQLLDPLGYPQWPTVPTQLFQRYQDVPATTMRVPTRAAFAATKTAAWHDRRAARDLYDLWGLARQGALDADAADVFTRFGPTGRPPAPWMFNRAPTTEEWQVQLGGQTRIAVGPTEALTAVQRAWAEQRDQGGSHNS